MKSAFGMDRPHRPQAVQRCQRWFGIVVSCRLQAHLAQDQPHHEDPMRRRLGSLTAHLMHPSYQTNQILGRLPSLDVHLACPLC